MEGPGPICLSIAIHWSKGPARSSHIRHGIPYIVGKIPQEVAILPIFNEPDKYDLLVCLSHGRLIKREDKPPCCVWLSPKVARAV